MAKKSLDSGVTQSPSKKTSTGGRNKRAGSSWERDLAKTLSIWVYGKESVIRRHPTSGSEKGYGDGADLAVFQPGYDPFEFFVEAKRGYKDDLFNARKQLLEWYGTAKSKNKKNNPIWIVWKILNRGVVLATDRPFEVGEVLFRINDLWVYDFKELTKNNFQDLFDHKASKTKKTKKKETV